MTLMWLCVDVGLACSSQHSKHGISLFYFFLLLKISYMSKHSYLHHFHFSLPLQLLICPSLLLKFKTYSLINIAYIYMWYRLSIYVTHICKYISHVCIYNINVLYVYIFIRKVVHMWYRLFIYVTHICKFLMFA